MLAFDRGLFDSLHNLTGINLFLDGAIIFFAKYFLWLLIVWIIFSIFSKKDWPNNWPTWKNKTQYFALGLVAFIISRGIVANIIDNLLQSPRPFAVLDITTLINHASVGSFPSGHMAAAIPLVLTLFLINRRSGYLTLFGALLMGLSRVISGVHWPSDILGGIVVGLASFYFTWALFKMGGLLPSQAQTQRTSLDTHEA